MHSIVIDSFKCGMNMQMYYTVSLGSSCSPTYMAHIYVNPHFLLHKCSYNITTLNYMAQPKSQNCVGKEDRHTGIG